MRTPNEVTRFLQLLESELFRRASLAQVNALLSLADPNLVLPSPAIGLLTLQSDRSRSLSNTHAFRSSQPVAIAGDLLFTAVANDVTIHPWTVEETRLQDSMLEVELTRPDGSACEPGWLYLHIDGGSRLEWSLRDVVVSLNDGERLECRRPDLRLLLEDRDAATSRVWHQLATLEDQLLMVRLPSSLAGQASVILQLQFPPGVLAETGDDAPQVTANAIPVWNSVPCRYPSFLQAERAVSDTGDRFVYPLVPSTLGAGWSAWSIRRVGAATDDGARFPCSRPLQYPAGADDKDGGYRLAYLPAEAVGQDSDDRLVLATVLNESARERLDRWGEKLEIRYRVTTGTTASAMPAGCEFHLIDTSGYPLAGRVVGRLLTSTLGGSDGLVGGTAACAIDPAALTWALPARSARTVGDVVNTLEILFGRDVELVDPRDLLRFDFGDAVEPLSVQLRFRRPDAACFEKRALLRACQSFLERYLEGQSIGGLALVSEEGWDEIGG